MRFRISLVRFSISVGHQQHHDEDLVLCDNMGEVYECTRSMDDVRRVAHALRSILYAENQDTWPSDYPPVCTDLTSG